MRCVDDSDAITSDATLESLGIDADTPIEACCLIANELAVVVEFVLGECDPSSMTRGQLADRFDRAAEAPGGAPKNLTLNGSDPAQASPPPRALSRLLGRMPSALGVQVRRLMQMPAMSFSIPL